MNKILLIKNFITYAAFYLFGSSAKHKIGLQITVIIVIIGGGLS